MNRHFNFADLFELAADAVPDRLAVVDTRRRVTFGELEARANRLAHGLQAAGIQPGEHVGILATNCIEWVEAMLAAYKIRARIVNVNFRYVEHEMRYLVDNSDMVAIVYQREFGPLVAASRDAQPKLKTFVRIEWDGSDADDSALSPVAIEDLMAANSPARDFEERSSDDVYLLYTGGTTGMPKGVMWRHEDVYFALAGGIDVFTSERVKSPEEPSQKIDASQPTGLVMMPVPPLMHGAGQIGTLRALFEGNSVVIVDKFDAAKVWDIIQRERVNVISITGDAMARPLADELEKRQGEIDVSSVVSFSSTAAIFSQTVKEQLQRLLPDYTVMTDSIGSTESRITARATLSCLTLMTSTSPTMRT